MDGNGDGTQVRYDPGLTQMRRERDALQLELKSREIKEKELVKRVRRLEKRLDDATEQDKIVEKLRSQVAKRDKRFKELNQYLKKLPTLDEFHQVTADRDRLESENKELTTNFREIKNTLGPYIEKVQTISVEKQQLEKEIRDLHKAKEELEDKLCCANVTSIGNKENNSQEILEEQIEQQRLIETNLMARLKRERQERYDEVLKYEGEISQQAKSLQLMMDDLNDKNNEIKSSKSEISEKDALIEKLLADIQTLTGSNCPEAIKEQLTVAVDELQSVIELTTEQSDNSDSDISELHTTIREDRDGKTLPMLMDQIAAIRKTILDLHASHATEKCQVQ
ncbi:unnamed protein product [Oikopleura dioica]|uniref:Uncharacterized protein n=1 Tax=Oikopleura dioica TaxID=34765 RepID=E4X912_OIKDI|nr:unnamed protein product [Oikopleura dioica]